MRFYLVVPGCGVYLIPLQFVMGLFQLGFITIFISEPLISGYITGAAVHVFTSQLQHITGLGLLIKVPPAGLFKIPKVKGKNVVDER